MYLDLTDKRFGCLTALYATGESRCRSRVWLCRCDCGGSAEATARDLRRGAVRSCGCLKHSPPAPTHAIKANLHFVDGTCVENLVASQRRPVTSRTGVRGVYLTPGRNAYIATIGFKGKTYYLGKFKTLPAAAAARKAAENEMFGEFLQRYFSQEDTEPARR